MNVVYWMLLIAFVAIYGWLTIFLLGNCLWEVVHIRHVSARSPFPPVGARSLSPNRLPRHTNR